METKTIKAFRDIMQKNKHYKRYQDDGENQIMGDGISRCFCKIGVVLDKFKLQVFFAVHFFEIQQSSNYLIADFNSIGIALFLYAEPDGGPPV